MIKIGNLVSEYGTENQKFVPINPDNTGNGFQTLQELKKNFSAYFITVNSIKKYDPINELIADRLEFINKKLEHPKPILPDEVSQLALDLKGKQGAEAHKMIDELLDSAWANQSMYREIRKILKKGL